MKSYSKNKFEELTLERQCRILLDSIYYIENHWDNSQEKDKALEQFARYFQWMNFYESENSLLKRLSSYHQQVNHEIGLRQLLDLAVPLERFLDLSIKDAALVPVREGDRSRCSQQKAPLYFVLDHLRSAFNVGSLFRTAECLGVSHIYLVGYTPTPEDRGVQKTAMGTEQSVSWSSHWHLDEVLQALKEKDVPLVALETAKNAQSLLEWSAPPSVALLVGNERFGLSQKSLKTVEQIVEVPLSGLKNSLNVTNALAIASFEVLRQWKS